MSTGLDNKVSNIIGTKIPLWVLNQFETRSKKSYLGNRNNDNLKFLANKTCWVRLVSSINLGQDDIDFFNANLPLSITTPDSLAKNYVLFAGTSKFLDSNNYLSRGGIGKDGAYGMLGNSEVQKYGYRPMPGIIDVSIETQGRLGSVRAATINFKCWDKDQLDIMDALYFKLGYSMFLEWGQTYFYPSEKNEFYKDPNKLESTDVLSIDPFIDGVTKEYIQEQITINNRKSEGNYDAMLGMVTNFTFSSNPEGGFNCTLKLMSLGILGDRLKINNSGILPGILAEEIKRYNKTIEQTTRAAEINAGRQGGGGTSTGTTTTTTTIQILSTNQMIDKYGKFNSTTKIYDGAFKQLYPSTKKEDPQNADLVLSLDPSNQTVTSAQWAIIIRRLNGFIPLSAANNGTSVYLSKDRINQTLGFNLRRDDKWNIGLTTAWDIPYDITRFFTAASGEKERFKRFYISSVNNKRYKFEIEKSSYGTATDNTKVDGYVGPAVDSEVFVDPSIFGQQLLKIFENENAEYALKSISQASDINTGYGITTNDSRFWPFEYTIQANAKVRIQTDVYKITTDQSGNETKTKTLGYVEVLTPFTLTFSDTDLIKYFKTPDKVKQGSGFLSKPDPNAPPAETPPPPPPAEPQTTTPEQIQNSLASQSSLELMLRTIQMHALNRAIDSRGINIGDKVYRLDMTLKTEAEFLKSIFSNGIFSDFILEFASENFNIQKTEAFNRYITNQAPTIEDRLKVQSAYGFASAIMKNKVTEADIHLLEPVFFRDLLSAYVIPYEISQELIRGTKTNHPVHIPLGLLLMILNHTCTIYDSKTVGSKTQTPLVYIDFNPNHNFCLSSKKQLSTNPFKVLIPVEATFEDYKELFDEEVLSSDKTAIKPLPPDNPTATPLFKSTNTSDVADLISPQLPPYRYVINTKGSETAAYRGQLMNILVSVDYLANLVKDFSTKDATNNVYLKPFLDQVIDDINKYLGNINILRVGYIDSSNTFQIIDDQIIPPKGNEEMLSSTAPKNTTMLPLYGIQSIAKSLEIKTDISSRLSNTLAISANATIGGKSTLSNSADSFGFINSHYVDRFIPNRLEPTGSNVKRSDDSMISAASQFNSSIKDFYGSATPNESNVGQATSYYIEKMQKLKNKDFATRASAMIPVSIEFSTDGIGGLSMGQAFTVPEELLPYTYDTRKINVKGLGKDVINKVGFVITGLSHNISQNSWNSSIKANMVYLKDLPDFSSSIDQLKDLGLNLRRSAGSGYGFDAGDGTIKTSYPELPLLSPPPPATILAYSEAKKILQSMTDEDTAKAVFAIVWAEASKTKNAFSSAGGYNYAGVQTDSGRWGAAGSSIIGRFIRKDQVRLREFAQFSDDKSFLKFMVDRAKAKGFTASGDSWTSTYINRWWSPADKALYTKGSKVFNQKLAIFNTAISNYNAI